jgi:hypothetical protein
METPKKKKGKTMAAAAPGTPMTPQQAALVQRASVNDQSRAEGVQGLRQLLCSHRQERQTRAQRLEAQRAAEEDLVRQDHYIEREMMRDMLQAHDSSRTQEMESMAFAMSPAQLEWSNVARPAFLQTPEPSLSPSPSLLSRSLGYFLGGQ